ncbi:MAG: hypothetical protein ABWZ99_03165 [Ilumatobacteraceae bacterium]
MARSMQAADLGEVDVTTTARYVADGFPWREWDLLRDVAPVYRYERPGVPACWVVTRYDDVKRRRTSAGRVPQRRSDPAPRHNGSG